MEEKIKRIRRKPEEIAADIDKKIQDLNESIKGMEEKKKAAMETFDSKINGIKGKIKALEDKKTKVLSPRVRRKPRKTKAQKIKEIMSQAQKAGLGLDEIAARLGVELNED